MITIKQVNDYNDPSIYTLYEAVKWTYYLDDLTRFKQMFINSLLTLGAYDNEKLVGLIRVIGDGEHILYIQDILVHPDYQGKGIGSNLLKTITEKYAHVRQKVLITDKDKNDHFYKKNGFKKTNEISVDAFVKFD